MSDFHRASLKMAYLRLRQIANKSTETENCNFKKFKQRVALDVELSISGEAIAEG